MKTPLTPETKKKIFNLLEMGSSFVESIVERYPNRADVAFLANAFENKFNWVSQKMHISKEFDLTEFDDEISAFQSALFQWSETLTYRLPNDDNANDIDDVLTGVLIAVVSVLEDTMIEYQDEEETVETESEITRHYIHSLEDEEFDEEDSIESEFERSFPD